MGINETHVADKSRPVANDPRKASQRPVETTVVVIGGGQAGLSTGYHLRKQGIPFIVVDASARVGDAWRKRWDSLRLFSPAAYDGLVGLPFPGPKHAFPTKDEMADYLEHYAEHFCLPVRSSTRVLRLSREQDGRYRVETTTGVLRAAAVVVAMSRYQRAKIPGFAGQLDESIRQIHSIDYRNPSQLRLGPTLFVGAGNSAAEIAVEVARTHPTWVSGPDTGHLRIGAHGLVGRFLVCPLLLRLVFHRVLTLSTPLGRKARPKMLHVGGPLIRARPPQLRRAGVERVPRTVRVVEGKPALEDGRVLDVANVVWCTGFEAGFEWIDLDVFDEIGDPKQRAGIVESHEGLYFVGLHFQYAMSSGMVHGVSRDAERVVDEIARRERSRAATQATTPARAAVSA